MSAFAHTTQVPTCSVAAAKRGDQGNRFGDHVENEGASDDAHFDARRCYCSSGPERMLSRTRGIIAGVESVQKPVGCVR